LTREQIQERVRKWALQIASDYAGRESLLLLGVLKGAVIFLADLARAIPLDCTFDFLAAVQLRPEHPQHRKRPSHKGHGCGD
jgi:hypoxanthine phosphoribosyltransferase